MAKKKEFTLDGYIKEKKKPPSSNEKEREITPLNTEEKRYHPSEKRCEICEGAISFGSDIHITEQGFFLSHTCPLSLLKKLKKLHYKIKENMNYKDVFSKI